MVRPTLQPPSFTCVVIIISIIIIVIVMVIIIVIISDSVAWIRHNIHLDSIKCIPPNSHGTAYMVRARSIYIYTCLLVRQLCVCLVLFCRKHRKRFWANLSYCLETISG